MYAFCYISLDNVLMPFFGAITPSCNLELSVYDTYLYLYMPSVSMQRSAQD